MSWRAPTDSPQWDLARAINTRPPAIFRRCHIWFAAVGWSLPPKDLANADARLHWMSPIGSVCLFGDYLENDTVLLELSDLNEQLNLNRARPVASLGVSRHAIEYASQNLGLVNEIGGAKMRLQDPEAAVAPRR